MKTFAQHLIAYRDANQWTNEGLALDLSRKIGRAVSVRTIENWIQGRKKPHAIWRRWVKEAIGLK